MHYTYIHVNKILATNYKSPLSIGRNLSNVSTALYHIAKFLTPFWRERQQRGLVPKKLFVFALFLLSLNPQPNRNIVTVSTHGTKKSLRKTTTHHNVRAKAKCFGCMTQIDSANLQRTGKRTDRLDHSRLIRKQTNSSTFLTTTPGAVNFRNE